MQAISGTVEAEDHTVPQDWDAFTHEQHAVWDELVAAQIEGLKGLASRAFVDGLDLLSSPGGGIPDYRVLNPRLKARTGWELVAVPGWIPNRPFFTHLANRRFPVANFLRSADNLAYSDQPDMFHDLFGHVPTLADPAFSDFLVAYGKAGLRAEDLGAADCLGRLWLYTVEFGLLIEDGALKAYGGGLLSSLAEARRALDDPSVTRLQLDIERAMRTDYHFDRFQDVYFVVDSFAALLDATERTDFAEIYARIAALPPLSPPGRTERDLPYRGPLLSHASDRHL